MKQTNKPVELARKTVASTKFFSIEQVDLKFSNGVTCSHERLCPPAGNGSVMVVPMLDRENFLLIREYASGVGEYVLGFPKGGVPAGEDYVTAANRELMEEAGYRANKISYITSLATSPSYSSHYMPVYLGSDLVEEKLPGDEPEPIEVVPWRFDAVDELLARDDFKGTREISALLLVMRYLEDHS